MKRIAVVGATGTIGRAVVEAFEARGDQVARLSRSSPSPLDLGDAASIERALASLEPLDALVCAAGGARFGSAVTSAEAVFEFGLAHKLMGQVRLARLGLRHLQPSGVVVLTSGLLAHRPGPGTAPVAMVNAALEAFVRAAAQDIEGHRLLVVSPPMVRESAGTPASVVAEAYLRAVDSANSGEVCFVEGHTPEATA